MSKKIELNGDFVVCKKEEIDNLTKAFNTFVYNKESVPVFRIVELHFSDKIKDFPFEVGDRICSASTGTIVNLDGEKTWLFKPEHILAKFI